MAKFNVVQCPYCGEVLSGRTHVDAVEDAVHLGWDYRGTPPTLVCPGCLDEEDEL